MVRGVAAVEPAADPRPFGGGGHRHSGSTCMRAWCAENPGRNLVFSPSTLASALGMAYLGARGATASPMAHVLHLPGTSPGRARGRAAGPAEGAWPPGRPRGDPRGERPGVGRPDADDAPLVPGRGRDRLRRGGRAGPVQHRPGKAAAEINQAISAATRGHISQAGQRRACSADVGWVLTSALYLDAKWATPFEPSQTKPAAVHAGERQARHRAVHERRRLRLRRRRRLAGGVAALQGRQAHDDRAAAAAGSASCALPSAALLTAITARAERVRAPVPAPAPRRRTCRCRR